MSRPVITAQFAAEVRERSRAGVSARAIAREKGVSRATVDRALALPAPSPAPRPSPPAAPARRRSRPVAGPSSPEPTADAPDDAGPVLGAAAGLDREKLLALTGELVEGLTAASRQAKDNGDMAAYGALAGKAQAVITAMARLAPPPPEDEREGTYVTHADMAKVAAVARAKLLERVARTATKGAA